MLSSVTSILSTLPQTVFAFHLDPLEQFDVLSVSFPIVGSLGVTNLSLLLACNVALMTA